MHPASLVAPPASVDFDACSFGVDESLTVDPAIAGRRNVPKTLRKLVRRIHVASPSPSAREFAFAFASTLRQLYLHMPGDADVAAWTSGAHEVVAHALGRGEDPVLREERQVCRRLAASVAAIATATAEEAQLWNQFEEAFWWWSASGELEDALYAAQRRLFHLTNGRIAQVDLAARRAAHPPADAPAIAAGVLGELTCADVQAIAARIDRDGCAVFPDALEPGPCEEPERFSRETPSQPILGAGELGEPSPWDPARATVTRAVIGDALALTEPNVRALAFDPCPLATARAYLGVEPTLTKSMLRWSAPVLTEPDPLAAQLFHFDLNRLNFLKAFIYVNDVGSRNGPHCFVRGSHRNRPASINCDGRLDAADVAAAYPEEDLLEFTGPKGTLSLADTRGPHLGKMLTAGDRLALNLIYSGSLAGKQLRELRFEPDVAARSAAKANPRLWFGPIRP